MGKKELWIHKLKPGTFREYLYKTFGKRAFTNAGKIKTTVISGIIKAYKKGTEFKLGKVILKPSLKTYRRAISARTLRVLRRKK